jgi:hypothetical protein
LGARKPLFLTVYLIGSILKREIDKAINILRASDEVITYKKLCQATGLDDRRIRNDRDLRKFIDCRKERSSTKPMSFKCSNYKGGDLHAYMNSLYADKYSFLLTGN